MKSPQHKATNIQHYKLQDQRAQMSHDKHFLLAKIWDILNLLKPSGFFMYHKV